MSLLEEYFSRHLELAEISLCKKSSDLCNIFCGQKIIISRELSHDAIHWKIKAHVSQQIWAHYSLFQGILFHISIFRTYCLIIQIIHIGLGISIKSLVKLNKLSSNLWTKCSQSKNEMIFNNFVDFYVIYICAEDVLQHNDTIIFSPSRNT